MVEMHEEKRELVFTDECMFLQILHDVILCGVVVRFALGLTVCLVITRMFKLSPVKDKPSEGFCQRCEWTL